MANPFVHVELNTTDLNKAKTFYGKLFDWTLEDVSAPGMEYTMIKPGKGTGGGMVKHPIPGAFDLARLCGSGRHRGRNQESQVPRSRGHERCDRGSWVQAG